MQKLTKTITKTLEIFLISLMALIVIDVSWQIFTRFILKDPSSYTEELAGFLLIWIGLLGASYALYTRAHLGIDILTTQLKGTKRKGAEILIYSIVSLFALFVLVVGGLRLVDLTFTLNQISPAMGIPMGYVYLVLPLTGILMIYYSVVFIIDAWRKQPGEFSTQQTNVID
ncbi:MAG: TRAP transporter small permease [Calditrichaeota bacterium]|nr:MAG: TRAP transporter small permease [Calditrichota bacterium]MBL1204740.1 TRAP transporter small permease [Calditrichota bacterium]NOG44568.1 TRAP transporter small permease [Calditrichota bacterium]